MKILTAVFVNALLSFIGFTLLLLSGYRDEPGSLGWIGGGKLFDFKHWFYFSMALSVIACIPVGLINGFILGSIKNSLIASILLAFGCGLLLAIFILNNTYYLQDFPRKLIPITIFFVVCSLCNIATVYLLKWKFPNSPLN
jgi:hypothetical protein